MLQPTSNIQQQADLQSGAPRVLVLLAAFNGRNWIEEQLQSILTQEGVRQSIIVADDASTDDTCTLIAKYGGDRLTLVTRRNPTGSAAQNFFSMIREVDAEGFDFVAFADQDDVWRRDRLRRAVEMLTERASVGYASGTTAFWPNGRQRQLEQSAAMTDSDFLFEGAGQGCTYVLTVEFYRRARSFLLDRQVLTASLLYHDWPIYALARAWNLRWAFDPESTVHYRQHGQNDTGARFSFDGLNKRLIRLRSGWYTNQLKQVYRIAAEAAPRNHVIVEWGSLILGPRSLRRRIRIVAFCLRGGRRKISDKALLICATVLGWI